MNRGKALVKNTFILSFGTFLPKLAGLVTLPIVTAGLTKKEFGTYDLISTLVSLFLPVVTLQIQSAAFRFLIDSRKDEEQTKSIISTIYFFTIPMSFVSLMILFFCLGNISIITRLLICTYFLVDILVLVTQQIARGLSFNEFYSVSAVIQSVINMLLIVWTIKLENLGLIGVLLSFIIGTTIGLIFLFVRVGIIKYLSLERYSFELLKQMLSYSWPMIPNSLSLWVLSVSDRLVLTGFMGLESVAIYAAANKIPHLFSTVQGTFVFAWQENASLALSDSDVEKYYSDMFDKVFCILVGIMALLIGSTPILFMLLIKGDYTESYPQMPILFMGIFFSTLSSFMGGIYVAHKRTKNVGITTMMAAACNLIIDIALVKIIGIYAASFSTLVSYLFLAIYRMHDVKQFQKISYNYSRIIICVSILVLMCVICWINTLHLNILNMLGSVFIAIILNVKLLRDLLKTIRDKMLRR